MYVFWMLLHFNWRISIFWFKNNSISQDFVKLASQKQFVGSKCFYEIFQVCPPYMLGHKKYARIQFGKLILHIHLYVEFMWNSANSILSFHLPFSLFPQNDLQLGYLKMHLALFPVFLLIYFRSWRLYHGKEDT